MTTNQQSSCPAHQSQRYTMTNQQSSCPTRQAQCLSTASVPPHSQWTSSACPPVPWCVATTMAESRVTHVMRDSGVHSLTARQSLCSLVTYHSRYCCRSERQAAVCGLWPVKVPIRVWTRVGWKYRVLGRGWSPRGRAVLGHLTVPFRVWTSVGPNNHVLGRVKSLKSRLVLPFWYRLTWVVPDKGPLNVCVWGGRKCGSPSGRAIWGHLMVLFKGMDLCGLKEPCIGEGWIPQGKGQFGGISLPITAHTGDVAFCCPHCSSCCHCHYYLFPWPQLSVACCRNHIASLSHSFILQHDAVPSAVLC